jgi:peptidoglycan/xylan/chitin deacetylase (PgdA/CDA1 family)
MRDVLYRFFWRGVLVSGINALYLRVAPRRLVLLGYHSVSRLENARELKGDLYRHLSVPADVFERQMQYLKDHGYTCISFADLAAIERKERLMPAHPVIVYFDDGYRDNFVNAYPILKKMEIPATLFIAVDCVEGRGNPWGAMVSDVAGVFLSWDEIRNMKGVFSFGTHTMSHRKLVDLPPQEVRRECTESRRIIEERTGEPVVAISYPKSRWNLEVRGIAEDLGFSYILSHDRGVNYGPPYKFLNKIPVGPRDTFVLFRAKLGLYYPLVRLLRRLIFIQPVRE